MNIKKKFLLCNIILFLSPCFTYLAHATTITNLDDVPHNIRLIVAGKEMEISLMPYERWESNFYPIKVVYDTYTSPAMKMRGDYAVWGGGKIALQNDRRRVYKRY